MDANNTTLHEGTKLCNGKYIIKKKLGAGGFGITYLALQTGLNVLVCIKEYYISGRCNRNTNTNHVFVEGASEELFHKYRKAFVSEAKLLAGLHHSNIVSVLDVFDENNTSYMVMEYIDGKSLNDVVSSKGPLSYGEVINYVAQISDAVGYIHERHILHRDIKPDNVMITPDYRAILIDFGSAREFEHDKTQIHTSMLTHGYAPAEQYTAKSRKGAYTDIYALGATLYFALTGEVPLEATARMVEPMKTPKELVPGIPDECNRAIMKAMQLKAENRHQSIAEFMDDIRNVKPSVLIDESIGSVEKTKRPKWVLPTAIGGAVVALIGILIITLTNQGNNQMSDEELYETTDFTGQGWYPMVKVDGGEFIMGGDEDDDDSTPHKVTVGDFYIGQFEVSQGLWNKILGQNPSDYIETEKPDSFPVENVSIEDVTLFIDRLNQITGQKFSLPTEAEWEFAARGGNLSQHTLYAGTNDPATLYYSREKPTNIKFNSSVNELGIYNMSGNVAELCQDYYDSEFYDESAGATNPINTTKSDMHVVRGGSFSDSESKNMRVFHREAEDQSRDYVGLRLVIRGNN